MTAGRPDRRKTGKRAKQQAEGEAPAPAIPAEPTTLFVDFDPWSVLVAQLMETPQESEPAERKRPKAKQGRVAGRPRSG